MQSLASSFEGELVQYYDLFFLQNNVSGEVQYVKGLVDRYVSDKTNLLDVGCGTGIYAQNFADYFNKILGIDISDDMIAFAREKHTKDNVEYAVQDIRSLKLEHKYGVATALSHVIGYQLENIDVENMLINVNRALQDNGIFIFNFYNAPQLFNGSLKPITKIAENEEARIVRLSNASLDTLENELLLDYYYIIERDEENPITIEIHEKMRYFTLKEITYYLKKTGFRVLDFFDWGGENQNLTSWNVGIVAEKTDEY